MARFDFGTNLLDMKSKEDIQFSMDPLHTQRTYGASFIFKDNDIQKLQIHYRIDLICLEQNDRGNYVFEMRKHQVFINQKAPSSSLDQLMDRCGKVLYPIQVELTRSMQILRILNIEDIRQRWQEQEKEIKLHYNGKVVSSIVNRMAWILSNPNSILTSLVENDWFYKVFFSNPYRVFSDTSQEIVESYPIFPNEKPIAFKIKEDVNTQPKREETIVIFKKGVVEQTTGDDRNNIKNGSIGFNYYFSPDTQLVDGVVGNCNVYLQSGKTKRVEIEIHNQKQNKPNKGIEIDAEEHKQNQEVAERIKKARKKKWFSVFK